MKNLKKITILSLLLFIACIFTSACGSSGGGSSCGTQYVPITNEIPNNNPNPTNNIPTNNTPEPDLDNTIVTDNSKTITFSKNLFNLNIGETEKIVVYVDGEDKTSDVTISLKDENVKKSAVALVENGTITALKAGSAVFKVSYEGINDNYFTVTVNDPELPNITVSKSEIDFTLGETDSENITVYLNEEDVTSQAKFTSSDESIATIDESGNITAISEGTTIIIVHVDGSNDVQVTVNVYDPNNHTITIDFDNVELYLGHNKNIKVTVGGKTPDNATFTSDDESIATVDENGKITAIGEGDTEITVQVDNIEETKTITVVSKNSVTLGLLDKDNINLTNNSGITYTSEDESIVTVDENGNLTAKDKAGNTNITVQAEGIEDKTITVTVNDDSEEVTLDNTVLEQLGYTKVAYSEFYNLTKNGEIVDSVEIPKVYEYEGNKYKIIGIGNQAFYRCTSITRSITIPDTVTSIGNSAFYDCPIENINIPENVTTIGESAFNGCIALKNITISENVTSIGNNAFDSCKSLTSVEIPESVTSIGNFAFSGCTSLTSVEIPESVTSIGEGAFSNCTSLTNAKIGTCNNLVGTNSSDRIFYNCPSLSNITIENGTIYSYAFNGCKSLKNVTLGEGVRSIECYAFGNCNSITNMNISNNVLCVFPNALYNCSLSTFSKNGTQITIPSSGYSTNNNITFINAKSNSNSNITTITIPNGVTNIPDSAFYNYYNLTSVTIPNGVTNIGSNAFYYCYKLTNVIIPSSVTTIGYRSFSDCSGLTSVTISNNLKTIGSQAFSYCSSLTSINLPNSVTSIGNSAFYNCNKLTSVAIGNNLKTIGSQAFYNCGYYSSTRHLTLTIPDSVTSIGNSAFYRVNFYYSGSATGSPWGGTKLD